eukprot:Seg485.7_Seg485.4 transcript_id=Seg485.7_Seg485.4/GoldUCD/mRNA.D3Y31 product="putative protein tag-53" protein_id=Seg485.7_Seg485.4/GoldUCD/D3Y31
MEQFRIDLALLLVPLFVLLVNSCEKCGVGTCVKGKCSCPPGFWGATCQYGRKRITKASGYLSDGPMDYVKITKHSWFIDSQRKNASIKLELDAFATECAWDHVYVYDGWSIYDPLVAAFSGNIGNRGNTSARSIVTISGTALVHFYSDRHLDDEGFNISYRITNCTNETCSNHGFCNSLGNCDCESGWTGKQCAIPKCCPGDSYNLATKSFKCPMEISGAGCPIQVSPRASHAAVVENKEMWIYGGYNFDNSADSLLKFDVTATSWSLVDAKPVPKARFGHSMVFYNKKLFIFGGVVDGEISNEIWEFDILTKTWKRQDNGSGDKPIAVTGHAAVAVANKMYVFMGYGPEKSYCNYVQQFDMDTLVWSIVATMGAFVTGSFGHSAVYDVTSDLVYVYGGYSLPVDSNEIKRKVSSSLFTFSPTSKAWRVMPSSGNPRMLHSSVVMGRLLVIYGGTNHYHETIKDEKKRCYSHDVLAYDIDCKSWKNIDTGKLFDTKGMFGHTAVSYNRTMYVFGGFDGIPQRNIIPITIGHCSGYSTRAACLQAPHIANCVWDTVRIRCLEAEKSVVLPSAQIVSPQCNATLVACKSFKTCQTCLSNTASCSWYTTLCGDRKSSNDSKITATTDANSCPTRPANANPALYKFTCPSLSTCSSCEQNPNCTWSKTAGRGACVFHKGVKKRFNSSEICNPSDPSKAKCHQINTCGDCTRAYPIGCMWCQSQNRCIDSEAYFANFPYGQCLEWINTQSCSDVICSAQKTCQDCFQLPGCGWCSDPSGTGIGTCSKGTNTGPLAKTNSSTCPVSRWYYTQCPSCQCNGHSQCVNESTCEKCSNNTAGAHCETCKPGYFGNALNNGTCKACYCNGHGNDCNSRTGKCDCNAIGIIGDHCERCDSHRYKGNASNGGHCFYKLQFGYSYNFNKSNKNLNFFAIPTYDNRDVKFEVVVRSRDHADMNFSLTRGGKERYLARNIRLGSYRKTFYAEDYKFIKDTGPEFKLYLYNFSKNAGFRVSFDQKEMSLNWLHFLIVFLICFCSLLIILIVVWKLKQQYSNYQYSRRRREELREMASRPFAAISIYCYDRIRKRQKVEPTQVALEPFLHGHAAVASILIELPRSETGYSPIGQSGLCVGSTLVTHRNPRITLNAPQQLCIFRERRKRHHQTPVNV